MRLLRCLHPKWHIDRGIASTSNGIGHESEWDWVGSLDGRCRKQNLGGGSSVVFSDQSILAKVVSQLLCFFVSLFPGFVCFRYNISDRLSGTKTYRAEKIPLLVCMSWISGKVKGRNQLYESYTQCFGLGALLSVCFNTGILQLTFLAGVWLVCLYTNLKIQRRFFSWCNS